MDITGTTQDGTLTINKANTELRYTVDGNPFYELHKLIAKQQVAYHDIERMSLELARFVKGGSAHQIRYTANQIKGAQVALRDLEIEIADLRQQVGDKTNQALADAARAVAAMYRVA